MSPDDVLATLPDPGRGRRWELRLDDGRVVVNLISVRSARPLGAIADLGWTTAVISRRKGNGLRVLPGVEVDPAAAAAALLRAVA